MKIDIICYVPAQIGYLGKNLVPEIWFEMLLANQIAGFLDQLSRTNRRN